MGVGGGGGQAGQQEGSQEPHGGRHSLEQLRGLTEGRGGPLEGVVLR